MILLEAETEFPNVEIETTSVDFGFIVNETTKRIPLRMKNSSCVPVNYSWYLTDAFSITELKSTSAQRLARNKSRYIYQVALAASHILRSHISV